MSNLQWYYRMPTWKKSGLVCLAIYIAIIMLAFLGAIIGIGGEGDSNVLMWLIIALLYPFLWLLNVIGYNVVLSESIALILFISAAIVYLIGAIVGFFIDKKLRRKNNRGSA